MRLAFAADPVQAVSASAAGASFAGAWWAIAQDIALTVLGVPLPVVLFAAFGAFGAGTFMPARGLVRSAVAGLGWMVLGVMLAQLGAWVLDVKDMHLPRVLPGLALVIAGGFRLLLPIAIRKREEYLDRAANRYIGPKDRTGPPPSGGPQ